MIYTLTFNPSIDYYVTLPKFEVHGLNRVVNEEMMAAGKGINVAKILHALNVPVCVMGFIAGYNGRIIVEELGKLGIYADMIVAAKGNTRINVKVRDDGETEINGRGPVIDDELFALLMAKIAKLNADDVMIISGSLGNGMKSKQLVEICQCLQEKGCMFVLDIADEGLKDVLKYQPFLIKPNKDELEAFFQCTIDDEDLEGYAKRLQQAGAQNILISLGSKGAYLLDRDGRSYRCKALEGQVISTVGAGDSMVAGFLYRYWQTQDHYDSLCWGVACGCATSFAPYLADKEQIHQAYALLYKLYHHHKRYFFFDIDGTLTNDATKQVVPSALKALKKLKDAGHFVAIATGRAHYKARMMMETVGLHDMVCSGGMCLVKDDQIIQNIPLDHEKALAIIELAESLGYGVLLIVDDSIDVHAKNDLFVRQVGPRQEPTNYIFDENMDYQQFENIYKIYVAIDETEEESLIAQTSLGHLRFVKDYLMFQHDAKDEGIIMMMDKLQADRHDVVVFGDDYNDLVMFKAEWTSIAMGNACEALKLKATYVAAKNIEDGIYRTCEKFGWFEAV